MKQRYQPEFVDGCSTGGAVRDCEDRYAAIREALGEPGAFTVADIGAYSGWFARRIAGDYPDARVTAIDDQPLLAAAAGPQVTVIPRRLDTAGLWALPRHDVTLALSVLHHIVDFAAALEAVRACRLLALVEVPHPDERWMRRAAGRHRLGELHDLVAASGTLLGRFERTGTDGVTYRRPMYAVPGTVRQVTGWAFTGGGWCSKKLPPFSRGLDQRLGYQPYPGSLNLRVAEPFALGPPAVNWVGKRGSRTRDYQFWRAWTGDLACHAMVPGTRGHGPDCIEMTAPVRLRDHLRIKDGDAVTVDVEPRS